MFYDPMIAKLVTWAPTREAAIDAQIAALDAFEIEGPGTNIDFLSALMQHPRFRSGNITTGFIAEEYPDGFHGAPADADLKRHLAAIAAFAATAQADRARRIDGQLGSRLQPPHAWSVRIDGEDHDVTVSTDGITVDGEDFYLDLLFYHRSLRRLVVIDLKLGKFAPADVGQMEFYMRWLKKNEMRPGEKPPLGLILCAEKSDERIEVFELNTKGIRVAEYLTALPPKKLLEQKLHQAVLHAQERIPAAE
jgi:hypothetical protein